MKKILLILFLFFPFIASANTFIEKVQSGYKMRVIEYDIKSTLYDLQFFKTQGTTQEPLDKILLENNAISWVNGAFFCPEYYSFCAGKEGTTNNERFMKGVDYEWYEPSWDKAMFAIDKNRNSFIFQRDNINTEKEKDIYYGLSNWPLILKDGVNTLEDYYDQWVIDSKMKSSGTKNFICNNKEKNKIYFGLIYSIDIDTEASILKDFWCSDALNLDAWLSTAFIYNGKYIVWPQRGIIDAVWIVPKFDLKPLEEKIQKVVEYLDQRALKISNGNPEIQKGLYKNYIEQFDVFKSKIYDNFSHDLYEENSLIWENEKVGYKIEINNEKALKVIYIINKIIFQLKWKLQTL